MLKVYLDNCCYGRPFDDLSQDKIKDEATAKTYIQSLIKYKSLKLYYSYMTLSELEDSPYEDTKILILDFIESNANVFIGDNNTDKLITMTNDIMNTGIKMKDATHLACAIFAQCDYFITTDNRVTKYKTDRINIVNPIEFIEIWRKTI